MHRKSAGTNAQQESNKTGVDPCLPPIPLARARQRQKRDNNDNQDQHDRDAWGYSFGLLIHWLIPT